MEFITVDPADISWLLTIKLIDMAVCLNVTINNYPDVSVPVIEQTLSNYKLCLLKSKDRNIDLGDSHSDKNLSGNKLSVASQYVRQTYTYLTNKLNISEKLLGIIKVNGQSQNYLLNQSHTDIVLCDALVYKDEIK